MAKQDYLQGLTAAQAQEYLKKNGYNELLSQKKQSIFGIFFNVVKEPMLLLLIGSGLIYLFLGEPRDAFMLLTFVFVVVSITFYQERKTERALEALKNLSSPRALVIRDGQQIRIPGREVVEGDIIVLREGDRVPADATVLSCSHLQIDESLLTGESLAVRKSEWDGKKELQHPGGEDLPFIFSGTLITSGHGVAQVTKTGVRTEMGKIGKELQSIEEEDTLLQRETAVIVRNFAVVGIVLCILVVLLFGMFRGDWLKGFLSGLTLSMAMLPEEFGVVLVIFLALGAWRMSRHKVLARKTATIETLGAATVLCVDKTGTLTLNKMQLEILEVGLNSIQLDNKKNTDISNEFHILLEYSILASQKDPFDPIEKEIKQKGDLFLSGTEHIHNTWKLLKEYPLSKSLLALSHVWESPDKNEYIIASKGAPEAIVELCHLSKQDTDEVLKQVQRLSQKGLRVLGVAKGTHKKGVLPEGQHDFQFELIGLLGFVDPVRTTVKGALKEAYEAGIRTIMITGDYPGTACHVAKQIGLINPDVFMTGEELKGLDHLQLRQRIKTVNIFARVIPEQKLHIVNALKANGEIVAMTGDGVNDAPALKSAHIGIAMGERGTDVAREAAALVLLNDDFSSIVQAVRMGRRIYGNLKKAMAYIIAVHVPIAGMSFFPVLLNMPIVLFPAHIAFLELVIDPACSVVFESEPEEKGTMKLPPRSLKQPLFSKRVFVASLVQGGVVLAIDFIVFLYALYLGKGEADARTLAFTTLVIGNIMLILTNLSWRENIISILRNRNTAMKYVVAGALLFLAAVLYIPFLRNIFHFTFLHTGDILLSVTGGIISIVWFEGIKLWINRRT